MYLGRHAVAERPVVAVEDVDAFVAHRDQFGLQGVTHLTGLGDDAVEHADADLEARHQFLNTFGVLRQLAGAGFGVAHVAGHVDR